MVRVVGDGRSAARVRRWPVLAVLLIAPTLLYYLLTYSRVQPLPRIFAVLAVRQTSSNMTSSAETGNVPWQPQKTVNRTHRLIVDYSDRKIIFTWPNSTQCNKYKTRLAQTGSLPPMALASFPGSGNTWSRYLIEAATGIFTGSVYRSNMLANKGFLGELESANCGCTLLQKMHGYTTNPRLTVGRQDGLQMVQESGRRAVLLIRCPYQALLAYRNHKLAGPNNSITEHVADSLFIGSDWDEFVKTLAKRWRDFYIDWLKYASLLHVIPYEDLKNDPVQEMRDLVRFLGLPEDEGRLSCIKSYPDGHFKRPLNEKQIFHRRSVFSASHQARLDAAIDAVQARLAAGGHRLLPLARYQYYRQRQQPAASSRPSGHRGATTGQQDERWPQ